MTSNHNPAPAKRRGSRRAARRWAKTLARLAEAGRQHGVDAAGWWQQYTLGGRTSGDVTATAARVLAGLDNLEPRVLDTLPAQPFSDTLLEQIYNEHTSPVATAWSRLRPWQRVAAVDAYRDAYEDALHQQVELYCRQVLAPHPADQAHTSTEGGGSQRGGVR